MPIVVTGAAGFIGSHVCRALLKRGDAVVGVDKGISGSPLKAARLATLTGYPGWRFVEGDVARLETCESLSADHGAVEAIIHLAAQPGVRRSLERPIETVTENVVGSVAVFDAARRSPRPPRIVYASSSSVYGDDSPSPLSETQATYRPTSLYALTKRIDEIVADHYADAWRIDATGLRFFTVYGPWGRPDMAPWLFASAILDRRPLRVFNNGEHERDFTYIDDVVAGVLAAIDRTLEPIAAGLPHRIYNIGSGSRVPLMHFIGELERIIGSKAVLEFAPMQFMISGRATTPPIESPFPMPFANVMMSGVMPWA